MLDDPTKRIRDPVHGLIVFHLSEQVDRVAWQLIDTPEFQRLRRVKQLGVSEFTFPGATHTRFAHCIGVYHLARELMAVADRSIPGVEKRNHRREVALLAALLHDLGHGPFSHAFEEAEKSRLRSKPGAYKNHEQWTAEVITHEGSQVRKVLERNYNNSIPDEIADLLTGEPADIYAAVVSSSFDADRLDYLQRDRMMTGSGAGSIDFPWLIDNLRVTKVAPLGEDEEPSLPLESEASDRSPVTTFCFAERAMQAAETFILARYHMYSQVYFHRTTRGMEQILTAFLRGISDAIATDNLSATGLSEEHPLVRYYRAENPSVDDYLRLDDTAIWSAVEAAANGEDALLKSWALRLRDRKRMKAIEIATENPTETDKARKSFIDKNFSARIGKTIFVDRPPLTIYGGVKSGEVRSHKRVRILRKGDDAAVDIALMSKAINALTEKQELLRYYFTDDSECASVEAVRGS